MIRVLRKGNATSASNKKKKYLNTLNDVLRKFQQRVLRNIDEEITT